MNNDYLSITEINNIIKGIIDNDEFLNQVYLKGEISNIKFHTRGHLYFSLKDEDSKINAVMFNYKSSNLAFTPKDGDSVLVRGKISVYPASGSYQIYVNSMEQDGVGNLYILFEELKRKLSAEGLFDEIHKKKIPKIPKKIGVITASTGAAVKDIITTINRRFPLVDIYIFPTLVQGEGAKIDIVKNIELAETYNLDTIIVGRGGGSIEDLWGFNEECVARAIYNAKTPIVSAVGHEIDYCISDFVADLRAPTPTAAAELVVPNIVQIRDYLIEVKNRLNKSLLHKITNYEEIVKKYKENYILNNPSSIYEIKEQKLCSLIEKISFLANTNLTACEHRFNNIKLKLDLLNPLNILDKGYSVVTINNKIIKDTKKININDEVNITLSKGSVVANIKEIKK